MTQRDKHPHPAIVAILKIAGVDPAQIWSDPVPVEIESEDESTSSRGAQSATDGAVESDDANEDEDDADDSCPELMDDAYVTICADMQASVGGHVTRAGRAAQTTDPDPADVARIVVTTLVEAARTGDAKAQRGLYDLHARSAHMVARRVLGDGGEAEDAVQDAFTEAFLRLEELRKPESFGSWLYRMVRNRSIDILRTRRGIPTDPQELPEGGGSIDGDGAVPAHVVVSDRETLAAVAAALESLTEADAKAIRLGAADVDGRDLAEELDVPDRAHAYVRLNRARQRLRHATGAVMLARHGLRCPELRRRLAGAGDSRELVRVVNRHVTSCEDCRRRRTVLLETPQLAHALEQYGAANTAPACSLRRRTARTMRRVTLPIAVVAAILGLSVGIAREGAPGFVPGGADAAEAATAPVAGIEPSIFDEGSALAVDLPRSDVDEAESSLVSGSTGSGDASARNGVTPASQGGADTPGSAVSTGSPSDGEMPPDSSVAVGDPEPKTDPGSSTDPPEDMGDDPPPPPPVAEPPPPPPPPMPEIKVPPPKTIVKVTPPPSVVTVRPPTVPTISDPKGGVVSSR